MSLEDTQDTGAAEADTDVNEAADTGAESQTADTGKPDPAEAKARRMGWRPKAEFAGNPDNWVDHAEFLSRSEDHIGTLKGQIADLKGELRKFAGQMGAVQKRAYDQALKDLSVKHADAVAAGDNKGAFAVAKEITDLAREVETATKPDGLDDNDKMALEAFSERNPWFGKDKAMTAYAKELSDEFAEKGLGGQAQLDAVEKRMRKEFPGKYAGRAQAAAVESGTPPRKAGKGFSDLPSDAKAMAESMERRGVMTKAEYAKDYFADEKS